MKLSAWAKKQGISYQTAWRYFKDGKIPNARQMYTGTILIDEDIKETVEDSLRRELAEAQAEVEKLKQGGE